MARLSIRQPKKTSKVVQPKQEHREHGEGTEHTERVAAHIEKLHSHKIVQRWTKAG